MICLQDEQGLVFWPERDVASLTPEYRNRWRAVMRDGSVAHRPTPPPTGPWVALGSSLVRPQLLQREPGYWKDPAGFLFPYQELADAPTPKPSPEVPGVPCPREQIFALTQEGAHVVWHTDAGDFLWMDTVVLKAARKMPELFRVQRADVYVNRERLRRLELNSETAELSVILDNGVTYRRSDPPGGFPGLGLSSVSYLKPYCSLLWGPYQVRDWPFDLSRAPGAILRSLFPTSRRLLANAFWQQFRYRALGIQQEVATSHRDLWYKVAPMLFRAGFLKRYPVGEEHTTSKGLAKTLEQILARFVRGGLLTYRELGFIDLHPEWKRIGARHPEVVLVAEKRSLADYALRLSEEFGVSLMLTEGAPTLIGTEHFRDALMQVHPGPIRVIAYVDYDALGWLIGHGAFQQLEFYGLPSSRALEFLVKADSFTPEEVRLYAQPLPAHTASLQTKNAKWVRESGGVGGEPLGIHANHVTPYERVRELFRRLLEG